MYHLTRRICFAFSYPWVTRSQGSFKFRSALGIVSGVFNLVELNVEDCIELGVFVSLGP